MIYSTTNIKIYFLSVPIVQKTVGKHAKHIVYYSETEDLSIPTENIGVPNTERGKVSYWINICRETFQEGELLNIEFRWNVPELPNK